MKYEESVVSLSVCMGHDQDFSSVDKGSCPVCDHESRVICFPLELCHICKLLYVKNDVLCRVTPH